MGGWVCVRACWLAPAPGTFECNKENDLKAQVAQRTAPPLFAGLPSRAVSRRASNNDHFLVSHPAPPPPMSDDETCPKPALEEACKKNCVKYLVAYEVCCVWGKKRRKKSAPLCDAPRAQPSDLLGQTGCGLDGSCSHSAGERTIQEKICVRARALCCLSATSADGGAIRRSPPPRNKNLPSPPPGGVHRT